MCKVVKRDGSIVNFDKNKIKIAITKAYSEIQSDISNEEKTINVITDSVVNKLAAQYKDEDIPIENIQDIVENELMSVNKEVAKLYITYRYKQKLARDNYSLLMNSVKEKLMATNVQNQNANVDEHSFGGRLGEATDLVSKKFTLDTLLSEKAKYNHINNLIYYSIYSYRRWVL